MTILNDKTKPFDAIEVLETAAAEMKDRAAKRDSGTGERSMAKTVDIFNILKGYKLSEEDGWAFMVVLKLVRGSQGEFHPDDYVDAAAYSSLQGEAASKEYLRQQASKETLTESKCARNCDCQGSMYMAPGLIPLGLPIEGVNLDLTKESSTRWTDHGV